MKTKKDGFTQNQLRLINKIKEIDPSVWEQVKTKITLTKSQGRSLILKQIIEDLKESRSINPSFKQEPEIKKKPSFIPLQRKITNQKTDFFESTEPLIIEEWEEGEILESGYGVFSLEPRKLSISDVKSLTNIIFSYLIENPNVKLQEIDISLIKRLDVESFEFLNNIMESSKKLIRTNRPNKNNFEDMRCPFCHEPLNKFANEKLVMVVADFDGLTKIKPEEIWHEQCYQEKHGI